MRREDDLTVSDTTNPDTAPGATDPDPDAAPDATAEGDGPAERDAGAERDAAAGAGVFAVRERVTWRGAGQIVALAILFAASVAFVSGGVMGGAGVGSAAFMVLGVAGLVLFGTGLVMAAGGLIARRPVLEFSPDGVRRPRPWPLPRRTARTLPWDEVTAIAALRRGVPGNRRGEQDYVVFLPTAELAETARTAERPALVALTMRDVPATAAAVPWCFAVAPGWDATLPQIVKQARRRRAVPVIDRRKK